MYTFTRLPRLFARCALAAGLLAASASAATSVPGVLWVTGNNAFGQTGLGTAAYYDSFASKPWSTDVVAVAAGPAHTLFVKTDGTVYAMGNQAAGRLGDGEDKTTGRVYTPTLLTSISGVIGVAAGTGHSLFLKADGTAWGVGANNNGELGQGYLGPSRPDYEVRLAPVQIPLPAAASAVYAAADRSFVLLSNGDLYAMGAGPGLGFEGRTQGEPVPTRIATNVRTVAAGLEHTLFLKNDETLWGIGTSGDWALGITPQGNIKFPMNITPSGSPVVALACGFKHSAVVKADGSLWTAGNNFRGALGQVFTANAGYPFGKAAMPEGSVVVSAAAGHSYTLALTDDGSLYAMGSGVDGRLGDGSLDNQPTPIRVFGGVLSCFAATQDDQQSGHHSLVLREPLPTITAQPSPLYVPAGTSSTLTLAATGTSSPLHYQWWRLQTGSSEWEVATGATAQTATLTLDSLPVTHTSDRYYCLVSNEVGHVQSDTVAITVLSDLETWRLGHFGSPDDGGDGADSADPDHDGRTNLFEYATGTNPNATNPGSGADIGTAPDETSTHLSLEFQRLAYPEITYTVEAANTLGSFSPIWSSTGADNTNSWTTVVDEDATTTTHPRRFLRLVIGR
ncbi:MAG: immunoglobulin domain-containing protein [Opitutaceae bacterium]|nr:immunoglobulin domain-containing protein [Opitutaceae bacterium]